MKRIITLYPLGLALSLTAFNAHAVPVSGQGTWETTLQARDLDGNAATIEAYYDTTLDITWLADANAGAGTAFDDGSSTTDGMMTWSSANAWAAALDINGINGWRLPEKTPIDGISFNSFYSNYATTDLGFGSSSGWVDGSGTPVAEMGYMYYATLGNLGRCTGSDASPGCTQPVGWGLSNTGPFSNLQSDFYWTSEFDSLTAWRLDFSEGRSNKVPKGYQEYAWAVHDGDVGTAVVPIPPAIWLFGSGLLGLVGMARRKKAS